VRGCDRLGLQFGIVKGLRGGWVFSGASSTDFYFFFGFSHRWVFSWVFGRCFPFGQEFLVYFVVVFSAQALGAGFRPGGFSTRVSTALTMGWSGWKFVAAISIADACYFSTYCFGLQPQLETKYKIS